MNIVKKTFIVVFFLGFFVAVNAFGDDGCVNSIDTCKVKVGKKDKGDRIKFSGFVFATEADFVAAIGDNVIVTIESEDNPDLSAATFTFPIEEDTLKNGKYKSAKVKSVDNSDPVTSFKVDTSKGKMKFSAKNVDLAGLSCPITVTIHIGASEVVVGGYTVVDTGQAACYDNDDVIACPLAGEVFYGQDAQTSGSQSSYIKTDDGIISDTITGLMWQQTPDTDGDGDIDADDKLTYDEAVAGVSTQTTGGYSDWRLPTIKELYSLIDFNGVDPSGYEEDDTSGLIPFIDTSYFDFAYGDTDAGERIIDAQYASSNLYVDTSAGDLLFGVNFADGRIKGYGLSLFGSEKTFFVFYVRGNTDYGQNDLRDNSDGTISDSATGLMWAQDDSGYSLNWQEALAWVQAKNDENYQAHNDWRLPNVKELQSIVDYTRSPGTTASAAIDPLFNATAIINEAGQTDYPCYWSSTTHANWTERPGAFGAYVAFGRAMGYMDGAWSDVHGAGAQRSDPKAGDPDDYPTGHGPQGDAIRIYNYVRCVRDILN